MESLRYRHGFDLRENVRIPNPPAILRLILHVLCLADLDCVCRFARLHRLGWKNLQPDDYLMLLVAVSSTPKLGLERRRNTNDDFNRLGILFSSPV